MTFNQFLIGVAFNTLSNIFVYFLIYLAIRLAISHGEISFRRRNKIAYGNGPGIQGEKNA